MIVRVNVVLNGTVDDSDFSGLSLPLTLVGGCRKVLIGL